MKLGILSSIYEGYTYEEVIDHASSLGYECVELAAWPQGKAERRYAGVSHLNTEGLTRGKADYMLNYAESHGIEISALAYYPNALDPDGNRRFTAIDHIYTLIDVAAMMKINLINTFIGRDQNKNVEENIAMAVEVWDPILNYAKVRGVKIGIENCPMLFDSTQWPGGQNIFYSPVIWREMFEKLPYDNFGLNFAPSHFVWQQMDYIKAIYDFKDKLFHIHFKDIKLHKEKLAERGVLAYPLSYMTPKLPGLGDVDRGAFVSALTQVGYDSYAVVEIEDKAFESSKQRIENSIALAYHYIRNYVI